MDRNTITGIVLIFLIFIGFSIFQTNRSNKIFEKKIVAADSLVKKGDLEKARAEYMDALRFKPNQPGVMLKLNEINQRLGVLVVNAKTDSSTIKIAATDNLPEKTAKSNDDRKQFGAFSGAIVGENGFITLENNKIELKISLKGGRVYSVRLKDFKTHDARPLFLFNGDSTVFGFNFFTTDNKAVQTNNLYFKSLSQETSFVVKSQPESVKLRLYADSGKYIEYTYTLAPDKYIVDFNVKFNSLENIIAANQNSVDLDWKMSMLQQEKGRQNEENYSTIMYKYFQAEVESTKIRSTKDEKKDLPTKLSWVAYQDQFFSW